MRHLLLSLAVLLVSAPALARDAIPKDVGPADLIEYLKTGGEDARKEACKRLGKRKAPDAVPAIGEAVLKDSSIKVRSECIEALEEFGENAQAAGFIAQALLRDPEMKVRKEAADTLQDVDPKNGGLVAAQALGAEKDLKVRKELCNAIEHRRWAAAEAVVSKLVTDPNEPVELRRSCLQAVVAIGSEAGYALAHKMMLEESNDDLRREASARIERSPKASSLQPLCQALKDRNDHIARNAAKGLKNLGKREGAACLREAAQGAKSDRLAGDFNKYASELER